jgi:hypothetical protein
VGGLVVVLAVAAHLDGLPALFEHATILAHRRTPSGHPPFIGRPLPALNPPNLWSLPVAGAANDHKVAKWVR